MSDEAPIDREAWIEIANRFRRAVLRHKNLQLDNRHVMALLNANFYPWIAGLEAKAMAPYAATICRPDATEKSTASIPVRQVASDRPAPRQPANETPSSGRCGMAEASRITGMKQRTLLDYVRDIPGTSKPAGRWLFDVEQLKAWSARVSRAKRPADRGRSRRAEDIEAAYERALGSDRGRK